MKTGYTIERSRWARQTKGVNKGVSRLLNEKGCMCCLGFVGEANGWATQYRWDKGEWLGLGGPSSSFNDGQETNNPPWPKENCPFTDPTGVLSSHAIAINDDTATTDAHKEEALTNLFAEHGLKLTFVD